MNEPSVLKDKQRQLASKHRKAMHAANADAGRKLAGHVMAGAGGLGLDGAPRTVSVFWAMGTEIDTVPLLTVLHAAGHCTALPVVAARARPLIFKQWAPGDTLVDGGFGTSIPSPEAETVTPEVLFVPLLSFDDDGYRLGYGGGFYDRTLEMLRAENPNVVAIGVAFSAQQVDTVPRGPHDQPLDGIATEVGLRRFAGKGTS